MGDTVKILRLTLTLCAFGWLSACEEEPLPPSVDEFMADPILLDATMVRCIANRNSVSYDPECINAREAVERIAAAKEKARRQALEAESERKREAVRRAQAAVDAAHQRAAEAERLRKEAEYLGLLPAVPAEPAPGPEGSPAVGSGEGERAASVTVQDVPVAPQDTPATGGPPEPSGSAVVTAPAADPPPATTDLDEIREQLEERQQAPSPESSD